MALRKWGLIQGMFVSVDAQIKNLRHWDDNHKWGFGDEAFEALPDPPAWPDVRLVAVVLVPYLQTVQGTFDGLWEIAGSRQHKQWRWDQFLSDPEHLRLHAGIEQQPGLRWEVIDLAANSDKKDGISPETVRDPSKSPHAGILACAAHFPKWVQAMDGISVPYVWLPGYEVTIPDGGRWSSVPSLCFGRVDLRVDLSASLRGGRFSFFAVPSFMEGAQN